MKQETLESYQVDGEVCPECDRIFDTVGGLRTHYGHTHDGSLVPTETCNECGAEFKCNENRLGNFCSKECQMKRRRREGLPARKRKVTITCKGCGTDFSTPRCYEDTKKYCSQECFDSDSNGEYLPCEWCGGDFYAYDTYADEARFCSQDCYGEWIRNEQEIEDHPRYKGGGRITNPPEYGPGWTTEKRERVRKRDGNECVDCGMSSAEHLKEYNRRLNVHHMVPARTSTNPVVYNSLRNLVTVCFSCHQKREAQIRYDGSG